MPTSATHRCSDVPDIALFDSDPLPKTTSRSNLDALCFKMFTKSDMLIGFFRRSKVGPCREGIFRLETHFYAGRSVLWCGRLEVRRCANDLADQPSGQDASNRRFMN